MDRNRKLLKVDNLEVAELEDEHIESVAGGNINCINCEVPPPPVPPLPQPN